MATDCEKPPRRERYRLDQEEVAYWPDIDAGALEQDVLDEYLRRKNAILDYLAGASTKELKLNHRMSASWLRSLLNDRCLQMHPDGRFWGWRALVPYQRINPYVRKAPVQADPYGFGTAGALDHLLGMEPDFRRRLDNYILNNVKIGPLEQINRPRHDVHAWFIRELRKLEYEAQDRWPFTVKGRGYTSLVRYMDKLLASHPQTAALIVGGPDLQRKFKTGDGTQRPEFQPFERVEMDAHKLDGRACVMIQRTDGSWAPRIIHRLWVIVIVEVKSRAVLGFHLSLNREVTKDDVLRTIKCALQKWHPPTIQYCNIRLLNDAGLPSSYSEKYIGVPWKETSVDGALAQTCNDVKHTLLKVVGSTLLDPEAGFASRRSKDDRPYVERFFSTLTTRGFHRLPISTGSSPKDKKGRKPEDVAVAAQFQLPYLEELLAALIANHNATEHSSLGYRSPLQVLDFHEQRKELTTKRVDPLLVRGLLSYRKRCKVHGGYKTGRQPYVVFANARYCGEKLAQRHDLVGQEIWVVNHLENDARVAQAFDLKGYSLGILRASPPWHRTPHSLEIRKSISALIHNRKIHLEMGGDAVAEFLRYTSAPGQEKLPVHPIYIAIQRLLAEIVTRESASDQFEHARQSLTTDQDQMEACVVDVAEWDSASRRASRTRFKPVKRQTANAAAEMSPHPLQALVGAAVSQQPGPKMPARRMAATKKPQ